MGTNQAIPESSECVLVCEHVCVVFCGLFLLIFSLGSEVKVKLSALIHY